MTSNSVSKKLVEFISSEISFSEFEYRLKNETSRSNPARVGWITETGRKRYYDMFWVDGPIGDGIAGGTDTKAAMDMFNIQVVGIDGDWRTVDFNTVYKARFNKKTYKVNN
jgi:hypothetical protein